MKISDAVRNAMIDALVDLIDGGASNGYIEIRTGSAPSATTDPDSGTLLATLNFGDPAFGAASSGTATANSISDDSSIDNTGMAAHFRVKDSDGTVIFQGTCGTSGADINFDSVSFVAGGTCSISSFTVTQPAS